MAWYDIECLNYDGLHISGYLADLVTVYDHLRAVELAALGSYKTTGWVSAHGSPVSCGYPHFSVQHSTLGATNIALATEWLRSQIGVSAYTWDVVTPSDPRRTPVGQRTILDFFCAIGRYVTWSSGYYTFSAGDLVPNSYATATIIYGIEDISPPAASDYLYNKSYDCFSNSSNENGSDTLAFYNNYGPQYRKQIATLTGAGALTLESLESTYNGTQCNQLSISLSTPSINTSLSGSSGSGSASWQWYAHAEYYDTAAPGGVVDLYDNSDTDSLSGLTIAQPTGYWMHSGNEYWVESDYSSPQTSLQSASGLSTELSAFNSAKSAAESAYNGFTPDCVFPSGQHGKSLQTYIDSMGASVNCSLTASITSTGPFTNKAYVYWSQSPKDYSYS